MVLQVDVRALKEDLWSSLQELETAPPQQAEAQPDEGGASSRSSSPAASQGLSFQEAISRVSQGAGARTGDVSVHLCFICMLHLANEHGLHILGTPGMDTMSVVLPVA